jgi:hypothetical protein
MAGLTFVASVAKAFTSISKDRYGTFMQALALRYKNSTHYFAHHSPQHSSAASPARAEAFLAERATTAYSDDGLGFLLIIVILLTATGRT